MGTDATIRMGLYQDAFAAAAVRHLGRADLVRVLLPDDDGITVVQQCILDIKAGNLTGVGERFETEAHKLVVRGAQCRHGLY